MQTKILGIRPSPERAFPSHVQWTGDNQFLSPPEVKAIIDYMDAQGLNPGTIGNGGTSSDGVHNEKYRCVLNAAVPMKEFEWLYKRAVEKIILANDAYFRFTLSGLTEPIGYLKYLPKSTERPEPGHYNWHQDFGGGQYSTRKLSLVVQLSDASEYTGCELVLANDSLWTVQYKQAGDAIAFPSWTPHRVTDIETGVRRALVLWIHGPQFK